MGSKQWLDARSPSGRVGGATGIATVVLALTTAMALVGVSLVGVTQLTGQQSPSSSAAIAPDRPPAPVELAVEPSAAPRPFEAAHELVARSAARQPVRVGGSVPRAAGGSHGAAAPASPNRSGTLVPTVAVLRVLSLATPDGGHTRSAVKNGSSWSGVKKPGKKHFRSSTKSKRVAKDKSTRPLKPRSVTAGAKTVADHRADKGAGRRK